MSDPGNGNGRKTRSGTRTLLLLASPLAVRILISLASGPKQQAELQLDAGSPAQSTLRAQLKRFVGIGAVEAQRRNRFPGLLEYELTEAGRELQAVLAAIGSWLALAPDGPLPIGDNAAKAALKAMTDAWSTTMLRALAGRALSLTELDGAIVSLNYPSLERRLAAMRRTGQVEPSPSDGPGTPYRVTTWLRQGVQPLLAAARWERRHQPEATPPIGRIDIETAFLLLMPLLRLDPEITGSCRTVVEIPYTADTRLAGAVSRFSKGRLVSCVTRLQGAPDAWVLGPPGAWFDALLADDSDRLEVGGDSGLARSLLDALNRVTSPPKAHPDLTASIY